MADLYYAAVEDDPLTSGNGSRVFAYKQAGTIQGEDGKRRRLAFIGDEAYCPKCDSTGLITYGSGLGDQHRLLDRVNGGRRQAVGGDIVLCKCADHPRIVAIYGRIWKIADRSGETSVPIATAPVQNLIFDEQVRAVAARASLAGYPYYIETESGDVYSGRIDSHGFLPRITTDGAEHYVIYWGDEALARKDWN